MMAAKKANDLAPPRMRREFFRRIEAPYKLTGVNAGEVEAVHERTLDEPAPPAAGGGATARPTS